MHSIHPFYSMRCGLPACSRVSTFLDNAHSSFLLPRTRFHKLPGFNFRTDHLSTCIISIGISLYLFFKEGHVSAGGKALIFMRILSRRMHPKCACSQTSSRLPCQDLWTRCGPIPPYSPGLIKILCAYRHG